MGEIKLFFWGKRELRHFFLDLCLRVPFGIGFVNSKKCSKKLTQTSSEGICIVQDFGDFSGNTMGAKNWLRKKLNTWIWEYLGENAFSCIKIRAKSTAVFRNHLKIIERLKDMDF